MLSLSSPSSSVLASPSSSVLASPFYLEMTCSLLSLILHWVSPSLVCLATTTSLSRQKPGERSLFSWTKEGLQ